MRADEPSRALSVQSADLALPCATKARIEPDRPDVPIADSKEMDGEDKILRGLG